MPGMSLYVRLSAFLKQHIREPSAFCSLHKNFPQSNFILKIDETHVPLHICQLYCSLFIITGVSTSDLLRATSARKRS